MIAFLDAEFNCGLSFPEKIKDSSLIEVAMIIVEEEKSTQIIDEYHSFCKPQLNHGRIYPIIKGMTHIKQADVNAGKTYPQVFSELKELILKYEITSIYVWGNFDRHAFIWNCSRYPQITDGRLLTSRIVDICKDCCERINVNQVMSLKDVAYICDCIAENHHNAVDDTTMLFHIVSTIYNKQFDQQKVDEFSLYLQQREAYNTLKKAVSKIKECHGNLEQFLRMAEANQGFPHFIYQKDR